MTTSNLTVSIKENKNTPDGFTLSDVLGKEFQKYYDGSGFDLKTKTHEFFFFDVPKNLLKLVPDRLDDYSFIKYNIY